MLTYHLNLLSPSHVPEGYTALKTERPYWTIVFLSRLDHNTEDHDDVEDNSGVKYQHE